MENQIYCHSDGPLIRKGRDLVCESCGSFADLKFENAKLEYGTSYLKEWSLTGDSVGLAKTASLQGWLTACQIDVKGLAVCEVGFGGGQCLAYLKKAGAICYGIETFLPTANDLPGLNPEKLFLANELPDRLAQKIDLWLFQDSFEHLEDPDRTIRWIKENSAPGSKILMVLPRGDSLSARILGDWWLHRMPHHKFHWSRSGIIQWFEARGWLLLREFSARKTVPFETIATHLERRYQRTLPSWVSENLTFVKLRFNLGEMGLLFVV